MANPSSSGRSSTIITDLDMDTLTRCASYLSLRDISNIAMTCKYLNRASYSDSIWQSLYRQEWPQVGPLCSLQAASVREAFLSRRTALHQFKYADPLTYVKFTAGKPPQHILFDKNTIIFSQGPSIRSFNKDDLINFIPCTTRGSHNARVTCMRLFSLSETSLYQSASEIDDNILITSSCDHFIRLWWKGGNRCFKGHTGPVSTLSDKLLGDDSGKIFASGGEDGTVRLWSISSSGKRGQHALKATLHGHEKTVSLMSVAGFTRQGFHVGQVLGDSSLSLQLEEGVTFEIDCFAICLYRPPFPLWSMILLIVLLNEFRHKTSLLVSISKNGKVKVWDINAASSSIRSSCCVGTTAVPSSPVGMKTHESLLYIAAGSSVISFDLRTMNRVSTILQQNQIHSFEVLPSKSMFCTGGTGRAMLWDMRRISNDKVEPIVELDGHVGPVKFLHMDSYKVVTGGPYDPDVNVWEANTGLQTNSLFCSAPDRLESGVGCSGMAVDGCRIVTAGSGYEDDVFVCYRDFSTATCNVSYEPSESCSSKFWGSQSGSDSEELD